MKTFFTVTLTLTLLTAAVFAAENEPEFTGRLEKSKEYQNFRKDLVKKYKKETGLKVDVFWRNWNFIAKTNPKSVKKLKAYLEKQMKLGESRIVNDPVPQLKSGEVAFRIDKSPPSKIEYLISNLDEDIRTERQNRELQQNPPPPQPCPGDEERNRVYIPEQMPPPVHPISYHLNFSDTGLGGRLKKAWLDFEKVTDVQDNFDKELLEVFQLKFKNVFVMTDILNNKVNIQCEPADFDSIKDLLDQQKKSGVISSFTPNGDNYFIAVPGKSFPKQDVWIKARGATNRPAQDLEKERSAVQNEIDLHLACAFLGMNPGGKARLTFHPSLKDSAEAYFKQLKKSKDITDFKKDFEAN